MIAVVQTPLEISLSRNPIIYKLMAADSGGNPYRAIGIRSEVRTSGFFPIGTGDTLTIIYSEPDGSETSLTFTGAVNPTTELEIPSTLGAFINYTQYYQAVADKIKAHPLIGPFFNLYTVFNISGQSLWIEALEISNDWNVSFDISGLSNPQFSKYNYPDIVPSTLPANHKILLDVFIEQNLFTSDFVQVASLEASIDQSGNAVFDIQDILDAELRSLISEPYVPTSTAIPYKADVIRRFYVRYREAYDGLVKSNWTVGLIKKVLCGGVEQRQFALANFFDTLNQDNSLLTYYPDGKTLSPDQPEYIAWFNYTGGLKQVIVELNTYTNASTLATKSHKYTREPILSIEPCEVLVLPVGFDVLGLDETVAKYTIRLVDAISDYENDNPIYLSQVRTYYVDPSYYLEKHYLCYFNSFNVPQVLRCIGELTKELSLSRETSTRILEDYNVGDREVFQHNQDWSNPLTYRSGYLSKSEVDGLSELLIYNQVYEVIGDTYFALLIIDSKYKITTTRQFLHAIEFKAIKSLKPISYFREDTPIPVFEVESEHPIVLSDNAGNVLVDSTGKAMGVNN